MAEVKNRRVTMTKHIVGRVKTSAYALPDGDFVYGIESKLDSEGAGAGEAITYHLPFCTIIVTLLTAYPTISLVVQSWAQSEPSKPPCSMQSFPASNRQALKNGCLTSKSQREYVKNFPVMKQNPKQSNTKCVKKNEDGTESSPNGTSDDPRSFGIQSKKNDVSMTILLRCIPAELKEETDYPDLSGKKRKGRLPPAKSTKSSRLVQQCRESPSGEEVARKVCVDEFKMKKFLNVKSKVQTYR